MSGEYPPMYFGITNLLQGKDEFGYPLGKQQAIGCAIRLRDFVFKASEFKEENKEKWLEFFRTHPSDETAKFMLWGSAR